MSERMPEVEFEMLGPNKFKVKVTFDGKTVEKEATMETRHETATTLTQQLLLG